jgi:hypothetical protein
MDQATGTILLVENDAGTARRIGRWLEDDGFEVLLCPGPSKPDYSCVGLRGSPCPLTGAAEVVVLDASLPLDDIERGTSSWELLMVYLGRGKPVVLLNDGDPPLLAVFDPDVAIVRKPPERAVLLAAVQAVRRSGAGGAARGTS